MVQLSDGREVPVSKLSIVNPKKPAASSARGLACSGDQPSATSDVHHLVSYVGRQCSGLDEAGQHASPAVMVLWWNSSAAS